MNRSLLLILSIVYISCTNHCEPSKEPTIILGLINNGILQIEKYAINELAGTLSQTIRSQHIICALNLTQSDYCFNTITCDPTTNNLFKLSSQEITDEHSFVINWGALLGINIADYQIDFISFIPWSHHEITSNHIRTDSDKTVMKIIYMMNGSMHEEIIYFDCLIDSICGIITPDTLNIEVSKTANPNNFKEAVEQGILTPGKNVTIPDKKFTIERDAEFDRIIDAMSHDGIIKFQKVTPFVAVLRRVGGILLVKYLTIKKYLYNLFYQSPHHPVLAHEEISTI